MPSKNNKKKAAAERSAKLAAEAPVEAPTAEVAELAVEPKAREPKPKEVAPYKPPTPLERLTVVNPLSIVTNSFLMGIKNIKVFRHDVKIVKYEEKKNEFDLAASQGSCRQRQAIFYDLIAEILGTRFKWAYDGAATLYTIDEKFNNESVHMESKDLTKEAKEAIFPKGSEGSLTISFSSNTETRVLETRDLLEENLSNQTSCPVRQMLQIVLSQQARIGKMLIVDGGNEIFVKGSAPRDKKWAIEMDGVGAGIKIVGGVKNDGAAHLVLECNQKTQFFAPIPLKDLGLDFNNRFSTAKFLKGMKLNTTYSSQIVTVSGLSDMPMSAITYPGGKVLTDGAKLAGLKESAFNQQWPAVQSKNYNKKLKKQITYSFPIENLKVAPNQKLAPKHGNPPKCAYPDKRFVETQRVGESTGLLSANSIIQGFGVTVQTTPVTVQAVTVPIPVIQYKGVTVTPDITKQAKWNIPAVNFIEPAKIPKILILYGSSEFAGKVDALQGPLKKTASGLGVTIGIISSVDLEQDYPDLSVAEAIEKKMESLKALKEKPLVIHVDRNTQQTHALLKLKERQCQVVTQQLDVDKALKQNVPGWSTLQNILLKLNVKSGGLNHKVVPDPMISRLWGDSSKTLIISYDVCHSSGAKSYRKGETSEEPSTVGFAFNGTSRPQEIIGDFHYQLPRKEEVNQGLLKQRAGFIMTSYVASRKGIPENIVILRDGVSEGQHMMVVSNEFPAIKEGIQEALEAINKVNKANHAIPKFALSIVTKRHAHRLYQKKDEVISNVPPMIAIDTEIVKKSGNELIFVSHCPLNGTVQPIIVNTLINENVFKSNAELVRLLAALSCAHQKSTSIVSLPETIYAADEYAKRGSDVFETYKAWMSQRGIALPMIEEESQYDWDKITQELCYHTSVFKKIRMA
uniref:Piwi domain-containing protein n=1 Tax=Caenorhabditis tropicalis TaxID=1561998 RepID=A0A1I7U485_9PELO